MIIHTNEERLRQNGWRIAPSINRWCKNYYVGESVKFNGVAIIQYNPRIRIIDGLEFYDMDIDRIEEALEDIKKLEVKENENDHSYYGREA